MLQPVLFHFIEQEYHFLQTEVHEIYKKMDQNFGIAILSYDRLNENQMFIDLMDVVYDNFEIFYERTIGFQRDEDGDITEESYLDCSNNLNLQHRDVLEGLARDLEKAYQYYQYFFVLETNFTTDDSYRWTFINKPILGVW